MDRVDQGFGGVDEAEDVVGALDPPFGGGVHALGALDDGCVASPTGTRSAITGLGKIGALPLIGGEL